MAESLHPEVVGQEQYLVPASNESALALAGLIHYMGEVEPGPRRKGLVREYAYVHSLRHTLPPGVVASLIYRNNAIIRDLRNNAYRSPRVSFVVRREESGQHVVTREVIADSDVRLQGIPSQLAPDMVHSDPKSTGDFLNSVGYDPTFASEGHINDLLAYIPQDLRLPPQNLMA